VTADAGGAVAPLRRRRAGGTGRRWRGARGDAARPEPAPTPHERMPSRHWPGARRPLNEGMRSTVAPSYRHHPPGTSRPRAEKTRIGDFSKKDRLFAVNPSSQTPGVTRGCDLRGAENRGRSTCYASYVDEPVMMVSGAGTKHYFHQNHLYSVAAMTSSVGAVVERYRYDAYGKRTVTNAAGTPIAASTIGQQRGFTGYYLDAEIGLYYARARMYSAGLGRFIARDELRYLKGLTSADYINGMSLYAALFIPNYLDPTGHKVCKQYIYFGHSTHLWDWWKNQKKDKDEETCSLSFGSITCNAVFTNTQINKDVEFDQQIKPGPNAGMGIAGWNTTTGNPVSDIMSGPERTLEFEKMVDGYQAGLKDAVSKVCKECCDRYEVSITCGAGVLHGFYKKYGMGSTTADSEYTRYCRPNPKVYTGKCENGKAVP